MGIFISYLGPVPVMSVALDDNQKCFKTRLALPGDRTVPRKGSLVYIWLLCFKHTTATPEGVKGITVEITLGKDSPKFMNETK